MSDPPQENATCDPKMDALEREVAQLSLTLTDKRLELDTLKLKAAGEWLEPGVT